MKPNRSQILNVIAKTIYYLWRFHHQSQPHFFYLSRTAAERKYTIHIGGSGEIAPCQNEDQTTCMQCFNMQTILIYVPNESW